MKNIDPLTYLDNLISIIIKIVLEDIKLLVSVA